MDPVFPTTLGLTGTDWIAVASIALPLFAKAATDIAAWLDQRHSTALARVIGMAGREAATVARIVSNVPAAAPADATSQMERQLVQRAAAEIMAAMGRSVAITGASHDRVATIVQHEVDKLLAPIPLPAPLAEMKLSNSGVK